MKIGFFLGSFDPIHVGHINMIREALNFVEKVIIVPSGHNPWKIHDPAPFHQRLRFIYESIRPFGDKVEATTIEKTFEPPFYANKSLNALRKIYGEGNELYLICGSDTVDKVPAWKNASEDILPYYRILCLERTDTPKRGKVTRVIEAIDGKEYKYDHIFINPLVVSSSAIRKMVAENKLLYPLVPQSVEELIKDAKLYSCKEESKAEG